MLNVDKVPMKNLCKTFQIGFKTAALTGMMSKEIQKPFPHTSVRAQQRFRQTEMWQEAHNTGDT